MRLGVVGCTLGLGRMVARNRASEPLGEAREMESILRLC